MSQNLNKIVRIQTEHSAEIKVLFDVLKEILTEATITFLGNPDQNTEEQKKKEKKESDSDSDEEKDEKDETDEKKKKDDDGTKKNETQKKVQGGIKIVAVDDHQSLMIYVKLNSENFFDFFVKYKVYSIGIDLRELHKFMKTIDKDCIMTMSIDKDEQQKIEFHLQNQLKSIDKYHKQKLLDTDDNTKRMPKQTEFEMTVLMDTSDFKKVCTEMSQFSEYVEILCTSKEITFKCVGDQSESVIKFKSGENGSVKILSLKNDKKSPIVQGIYNLKQLVTFGRCVNLCNDMQLYLRNSYPLFIHYTVGSLGKMLVGLTPTDHESIKRNGNFDEKLKMAQKTK
jgi:proliferating cell nuclear antigen PCNA